jgi:methyl-accepting chemotaxis protein
MKLFDNLKTGIKLSIGFLFIVAILIGILLYTNIQISTLGRLQDGNIQRSKDAIRAEEGAGMGAKVYRVIADTEINLNFETSQTAWNAIKSEMTDDLAYLKNAADNEKEKLLASQASEGFDKLITLYEKDLLPALKAANATTQETNKMDGEIDGYITEINTPLSEFSSTLQKENLESDRLFDEERSTTQTVSIITGILGVLVAVGLAFVITRSITSPLAIVVEIGNSLSNGDLVRDLSSAKKDKVRLRKDEIGDLGRAFDRLIKYMQEMGIAAERIASNDLSLAVTPKSEKDELGNSFVKMVGGLRDAINEINDNANNLSSASIQLAEAAKQAESATSQISITIQQVARGTSDQASSVNKTASATEQMSKAIDGVAKGAEEQGMAISKAAEITSQINIAIQQVAENAESVTVDAAKAADAARIGAATVEVTLSGMHSIKSKVGASAEKVQVMGHRSNEIGAIVETIQDIASQTNLLALNAAIEAARAGEHGKGFAVVADEVRKLAERSSQATKEIGGIIAGIQTTVEEAVKAMEEGSMEVEQGVINAGKAGTALTEIISAALAVNNQANLAKKAAEHMSAASSELVSAVDSVSAVVEQNTAATEEMSANSAEVTLAIEQPLKKCPLQQKK